MPPQSTRGRVTKSCETCGKAFTVAPARAEKRRFCQWSCYAGSAGVLGSCLHCGSSFRASRRQLIDGRGKFCSHKCSNDHRATGHITKYGYLRLSNNGKFYLEHRKIAEDMIGRPLKPNEVVHHDDENKLNNDPSNLKVMTRSEHQKLHLQRKRGWSRLYDKCLMCQTTLHTYAGRGYCRACYHHARNRGLFIVQTQ